MIDSYSGYIAYSANSSDWFDMPEIISFENFISRCLLGYFLCIDLFINSVEDYSKNHDKNESNLSSEKTVSCHLTVVQSKRSKK